MPQDTDNAWKDVLEGYFADFLRFFFPQIHAAIDWSWPVEFLETEFVPLVPQSLQGKALVDKLARVRLLDGKETVVHIHVEVQGYPDPAFDERVLRYNVLARERLGREVISLAVLTDSSPSFRPSAYDHVRWGFRLRMELPTVKLLDFRGREEGLRSDPNPFSVVVLAHLLKMEGPVLKHLYRSKLRLIRLLYHRGYERQQVRDLLRFLDWILRLPEDLEDRIMNVTLALEGRTHMPYLSNIERRGLKKGMTEGLEKGKELGKEEGKREGLLEAIALGLEIRFGAHALELLPRVREVQDLERLRQLVAELQKAPALEAFAAAIETPRAGPARGR